MKREAESSVQSGQRGTTIDPFFFFPPASSESYCFIIHAPGANRPLARRRSVAVLTVHGTLRAAGPAPPTSPRVIPAAGGGSRASVSALSDGVGTAPAGGRWSRETVGSVPAASAAWQPCSWLLLELSPIHVPATHSRPRFCSGCPRKRESLPARGAGASNNPVSTPTLLWQRGNQSTNRE